VCNTSFSLMILRPHRMHEMMTIAIGDSGRLFVSHVDLHGWMDGGRAWGGDSWGPKEQCIIFSSTDSMRPSPNYFRRLLLSVFFAVCMGWFGLVCAYRGSWMRVARATACSKLMSQAMIVYSIYCQQQSLTDADEWCSVFHYSRPTAHTSA